VWEAMGGELITQTKHPVLVDLAHFSPDGRQILTAADDGAVRLWDAQSGQSLMDPMTHSNRVWFAIFSPDATRVLTLTKSDKAGYCACSAAIWDVQPRAPHCIQMQHEGSAVATGQFSPDGRKVLTSAHETMARIWEQAGGEPIVEPLRHAGIVRSAEFSPDGTRLLTAADDGTARVWDAERGLPLTQPLATGGGQWATAEFSRDGTRVVAVSEDGVARVWEAQTGLLRAELRGHGGVVRTAQFSPRGDRIVTASEDGTARVWDAQNGLPLTGPLKHGEAVRIAEFSPDGKRVVTASKDGTARVWDAQSGLPLTQPLRHKAAVRTAQFSQDGRRIVTASKDATARVWDAQSGVPVTAPLIHSSGLWMAAFTRDGERIVTASEDGTSRLWRAGSGQMMGQPLKHGGQVLSAQFSPDGTLVVTASADGTARLWDAENGAPLTEPFVHGGPVLSAQFIPNGNRIVTCSGTAATVWDIPPPGSRCPNWLPHIAEAISGRAFSPKGGLEPIKAGELWAQIARELGQSPVDDAWKELGHWLLADPSERTVSPFSKITAAEYVQRRLGGGLIEPLDQALRLARKDKELWRHTFDAARAHYVALDLSKRISAAVADGKLTEAGVLYRQLRDLVRQLGIRDPMKWLAGLENASTVNGYAWLLAVCDDPMVRDGATAVTLAEQAVRLTRRKEAYMLDTLAAAYAELGWFDAAVAVLKEALVLPADDQMKIEMTGHLKLFESRTPFRVH